MYKVLLVDDEMPALRFLQTIIEKFARELTIAQSCLSGEAALAFLRENKVDLLITDISMSGMDGIALAHAARALQPEIHIVIVTGYAEFEYAKGAIQAAVDDYILKPVSVSHMAEVLGKIKEKGYTLVPLQVYFKDGKVKVEIGLARGKKLYDKRQDIAKRDQRREVEKEFKVKNLY